MTAKLYKVYKFDPGEKKLTDPLGKISKKFLKLEIGGRVTLLRKSRIKVKDLGNGVLHISDGANGFYEDVECTWGDLEI